jgi:Cu(I)/Ag(I) efflux system membrane fusion protein
MTTQIIPFIILVTMFSSCSVDKTKKNHHHAGEPQTQAFYTCSMHPSIVRDEPGKCPICGMDLIRQTDMLRNDILTLTERQIQLANITTQKVSTGNRYNTNAIQARLIIDDTRTSTISSTVAGRIDKLFIKDIGRMIKQGEPLYKIYSEPLLTLQREYLLAKEQSEKSGNDNATYKSFLLAAERKLMLYGLNATQIGELSKLKNASNHVTIMAPVSGLVTKVATDEGQYVDEGSQLYKVADISALWVEADVYPDEISSLKPGDKIRVTFSSLKNKSTDATINFISPEYKTGTKITTIRATIKNDNMALKPGMRVLVFTKPSEHNVMTVSKDAIIHDSKDVYVFAAVDTNMFQARKIKIRLENSARVEVVEGLADDDFVVTSGTYLLYSEMILRKGTGSLTGHNH